VHFLLAGFLLFVLFRIMGSDPAIDDSRRIVVSDDALVALLRFRTKVYASEPFEAQYESLSTAELQQLVDEFVRVEALYREAMALGLDKQDLGLRQRLISQLEFIHQGVVSSAIELSDDDLREYLDRNKNRYGEPPTITFTHVFFSNERRGGDDAMADSQATLKQLNSESGVPVAFHEAPKFGDRFLYGQNYVNEQASEIRSHFGREMQQQLFALDPDDVTWRGPFHSPYGYHLVLVTKRVDRYLPSFAELRPRLLKDAYRARVDEQLRQLELSVVESYIVELDDPLKSRLEMRTLEPVEAQK
jgi:peptidyl-prolyl cis-trans isomerase C